jgi:hypothetical protein
MVIGVYLLSTNSVAPAVTDSVAGPVEKSVSSTKIQGTFLRRQPRLGEPSDEQRRLPGRDFINLNGDFTSAEAGFLVGLFLSLFLVVLLTCICCGRCSLWDIIALVCLWEICCDPGVGPNAFMLI